MITRVPGTLGLIALGILSTAATLSAQPEGSWVGKRVMTTRLNPKLWDPFTQPEKPRAVGEVREAHVLVDQDQKGYVFVRTLGQKGWLKKEDAVPMESAIPYFSQRIEQNPNEVFARSQRAILWKDRKEYDKALADYDECIRLQPKNAIHFHNRGVMYAVRQDHNKAISDYSEAIRIQPKYMLAHRLRGQSHHALKEYDKALADYDRAIELNPKFAGPYYDRGNTWFAKKDTTRALADFNEAIRLDPKEAAPFRGRGLVHRSLKEYAKAIADFEEAARINPKHHAALADLAWLLATGPDERFRNGKKAVAAAKKACELTAWKTAGYLSTLAAAHAEAGEFDEAIRWQARALEFPDYARLYENVARARLKLYEARMPYREKN